jgi:lipoate-protein ligase A
MAKDEAIGLSVKEGKVPCTLRLYQWDRLSVTLGRYQRASDVDLQACKARDIPVVRRPTGGRAILHGQDLTYSFSSRIEGPFSSGGLLETYGLLSRAFLVAFKSLGLPVQWKDRREKGRVLVGSPLCFQSVSYGEITLDARKVIGSAQKRWEDAFLQQGTIMLEVAPKLQEQLFLGTSASTIRQTMAGLMEFAPSLTVETLQEAIVREFEKVFEITFVLSCLTPEEEALTEHLLKEKYLTEEFLLER